MALKQQRSILIEKRKIIFSRMQRTFDFISSASDSSFTAAKARYDQIDDINSDFKIIQNTILEFNSNNPDEKPIEIEKTDIAFEDMVFAARIKFDKLKSRDKVDVSSAPDSFINDINLPKLKISPFKGDIGSWRTFYELYNSCIHTSSMPTICKFQHLRSLLHGEALQLIEHFPLTESNYNLALSVLIQRYQNSRLLASHYLNKLLNYKPTTLSSIDSLQEFLAAHKDSVEAFKALNIEDKTDFLLFHIAYNHLDKRLQSSLDQKHDPNEIPKFQKLVEHVEASLKYAQLHSAQSPSLQDNSKGKHKNFKTHTFLSEISQASKYSKYSPCILCKNLHPLYMCYVFKNKSIADRLDIVKKHKICYNCLSIHFKANCRSSSRCKTCGHAHHTLLHDEIRSHEKVGDLSSKTTLSSQNMTLPEVLLGTVQIYIQDSFGQFQTVRAVLDSCSQSSIITASCVRRLGLKPQNKSECILGVGNTISHAKGIVKFIARSRVNTGFHLPIEALVLSELNHVLPTSAISKSVFEKFQNFALADPKFHVPGKIDLILGVDVFCAVTRASESSFLHGTPSAMDTAFGWVIMGRIDKPSATPNTVSLLSQHPPLNAIIQKFWETEEVQASFSSTPEDKYCEELFCRTVARTSEGRYIVSLPFKSDCASLADNRSQSLKNFINLEKRLLKHPSRYEDYTRFMHDYLEQNHMIEVNFNSKYVIPQQVIIKDTSTTTKLRTVFNASAIDSVGLSLNDRLLSGPKLQADLSEILLKFRLYRYAISADIKQMYRQILLHKRDQAQQHIFWRSHPENNIKEYQLCTVTYGMTPSAYLAQRVLKQLVTDEGHKYPRASQATLYERYIDDFLTGADTRNEALCLYDELTSLLSIAGFELRKWSCNDDQILKYIPSEHRECPLVLNDNCEVIKLLGMYWDPKSDYFQYKVEPFQGTPTKRGILSYIARIYDPLGFLAPIVFWVKHFIQILWIHQQDWDTELSNSLLKEWTNFTEQLILLRDFKIPRFILFQSSEPQLIGFADASERGFAACVYLRIKNQKKYHSYLVKAKTKVAPLKKISVPRLELQAALLLTTLVNSLLKQLPKLSSKIHLFTDSQIVLAWLRLEPHKLTTFVANRVKKIQDSFPAPHWHHVPSRENPADAPSRGLTPKQFLSLPCWLCGPLFLRQEIIDSREIAMPTELPDLKQETQVFLAQASPANEFISWTGRFSNLCKLKRVFALVLRYSSLQNCLNRTVGPPSREEQERALIRLIQIHQRNDFGEDFKRLAMKQSPTKPLQRLSIFLEDGLLKVGGRLSNSHLPDDAKHPLLLAKKSHLAALLVRHFHLLTGHSGPGILQALLQQQFWVIGARPLIRKLLHQCVTCARHRAKVIQPVMSDLPISRVTPSRPFTVTGTDFAGPFSVLEGKRRNSPKSKGYLCVFVCFSTKAVHLEFVSSLSSEAFLAALDRFVSRRGCPNQIYSDNGTNFIGAARQLREVHEFFKNENDVLLRALAMREIEWKFQPPYAPHFGGLSEAAVKSAKRLLSKMLKSDSLFFEEYSTLFARVEAIMNSRPLCALNCDPSEEINYLSPGHFLIGAPLLSPPEPILSEDLTFVCRWQKLRQMTQGFWKRWSSEYLQTLQCRYKWLKSGEGIREKQVVLLRTHSPPMRWPLGLIVKLHPGPDGVVRVVEVRVGTSIVTRAVNQLVPLPIC